MIVGLITVFSLVAAVALMSRYAPKADVVANTYGSDASFLDNFSLLKYRPMIRLASQMDRRYLGNAHSEKLASCYRKIQRGLLREYLRDASRDFNRLYAIANAKCVQASADPGDLSMALFEQQMTFILLVWGIEARLLVDSILPFALDLKPLMHSIESLAKQTRQLARPEFSYHAV